MVGHADACWILPPGRPRCRAYVCIPVEDSLASRSPVIETLMEIEGIAELPDGVPVADFLSWSSMATDELSAFHADDVCQALRVADKMCDNRTEVYAAELASRLSYTQWDSGDADEMQSAILGLETGLQHLVLRQIEDLASFVSDWPMPLQQVYYDMVVTSGYITIGRCSGNLNNVISMLSRTLPASPGLQTLTIDPAIENTATAALLSAALLQHAPSLSALHLPALACKADTEAVPTIILAAAARCRHLTSLHIAFDNPLPRHSHAAAHTLAALAAAVAALPHLADFRLHHISAAGRARRLGPASAAAASPRKRQRLAEGLSSPPPPLTLDPVVAALAAAPALTSLALSTDRPILPGHSVTIPCSGVTGAFATLRNLDVGAPGRQNSWLPTQHSTPLPVSPLPALTALSVRMVSCDVCPTALQTAICAAAQQPRLRMMKIVAREAPVAALHAFSRFGTAATATQLQALTVKLSRVGCVNSMRTVAAGVAHVTALRTLILHVACIRDGGWGDEVFDVDDPVYDSMLQPLTALHRLNSLSLEFPTRTLSPFVAHSVAAAPLRAFPGLTKLRFDVERGGLRARALAPRLSGLSRLQDFSAVLRNDGAGYVRSCLEPLTALTSLDLTVSHVDAELVRSFGDCAAGMPHLQGAKLQGSSGAAMSEDEDSEGSEGEGAAGAAGPWVLGLSHLPSRGHYRFEILWSDGVGAPGMQEARAALEARGAVVSDHPLDGFSVRF